MRSKAWSYQTSGFVDFLASSGRLRNGREYIAEKIAHLRVLRMEAEDEPLLWRPHGSVLLVSQFTLLGDARKGRRPSFIAAERPERADELYQVVKQGLESLGIAVETGVFRTHMEVELVNDGPVTILLDSRRVF